MKRLLRLLAWPVRRLLDGRFDDTHRRLEWSRATLDTSVRLHGDRVAQAVHERIDEHAAAHRESLTFVGDGLRDVAAAEDRTEATLRRLQEEVATLRTSLSDQVAGLGAHISQLADRPSAQDTGVVVQLAIAGGTEHLDGRLADLLNYAQGHTGFAAERGLWFNPSVTLLHSPGDVRVGTVNARVVEEPFAFRALAGLAAGAGVLDVGAAESTIAFALASLGHRVVALDPRGYPLVHSNLEVVASRLEDFDPPAPFDAVLAISTIEHVGLGAYGETPGPPDADRAALARMASWLAPGGRLVLTVPFATTASVDFAQRTYDERTLDALLEGWDVQERLVVTQSDPTTWAPRDPDGNAGVALIVAARA